MYLLTAVQHRPKVEPMSPLSVPACMPLNPVSAGRMPLCAGAMTVATVTITTTTITTRSGWVAVRE